MGGAIKSSVIIPGTNLAPIDISQVSSSLENTTSNVVILFTKKPIFKSNPVTQYFKDKWGNKK